MTPPKPKSQSREDLLGLYESSRFKPKKKESLLQRALGSLNKPIGGGKGGARKSERAGEVAEQTPKPLPEYVGPDSPWFTDARRFPHSAAVEAKVRFCLRYAVLAPSSHNTQPWTFRLDRRVCEVRADRTKALPVCDPHDRELTISVGCAVWQLRLALRRFGLDDQLTLLPEKGDHDLMARIEIGKAKRTPTPAEVLSFEAIPHRRTCRHAFKPEDPPAGLLTRLTATPAETGATGVTLHLVKDLEERRRLATLVHEADVVQFNQRAFRRELALWMHHNRTHERDGIPGYAMGLNELESLAAPLVVRTFDMGEGRGAKDEQLALRSPVLAVLSTERDDPTAWLEAGQVLAEVLLRATSAGLSASYLNQPLEMANTRVHVQRLVGGPRYPQIVLRMGVGPKVPHTPRRDPREV